MAEKQCEWPTHFCLSPSAARLEKVFGTDIPRPGVIRADVPWQKLRTGPRNLENKHLGADIHDWNARTPMTPGRAKKLRAEKLRADFSFPNARTATKGVDPEVLQSRLG